jgi:hypothetical protein
MIDHADADLVYWVGKVQAFTISNRPDVTPRAARTGYRCIGAAGALAQVWLPSWYVDQAESPTRPLAPGGTPGDALTLADITEPLEFNPQGRSNRSVGKWDLATAAETGGVGGVYVHSPGRPDTTPGSGAWTAKQAVDCLLAHYARAYPDAPPITLTGAGALLNYVGSWEVSRRSLFDQLSQIIHPDYGVSLRWTVSAVGEFVATVIDLTTVGAVLDLRTPDVLTWSATMDATGELDLAYWQGPRPRYVHSFAFQALELYEPGRLLLPLVKDWVAGDEGLWDAADAKGKEVEKLAHVWRRWALRCNWRGYQWDGTFPDGGTVPYGRQEVLGEETGVLAGTGPWPNCRASVVFDRTLPLGPGPDWATSGTGAAKVDPTAPEIGGLVWTWDGSAPATGWRVFHFGQQVEVGERDASLTLGRDTADQKANRKAFEFDQDHLYIVTTLAFLHPLPLRVSAKRAAQACEDLPRTGVYYLEAEYYQQVQVIRAITGLDAAGAPVYAEPGRRDAGGDLTTVRDKMRAFRLTPDGSLRWTAKGVAADTLHPPGFRVDQIQFYLDAGGVEGSCVVGGVPVTRVWRSFDFYDLRTEWTADRIAPGFRVPHVAGPGLAPIPIIPPRAGYDFKAGT